MNFQTTLAIAATATVGYLIYFDYKRRSSPEFRKKLRQDRIEAQKIKPKSGTRKQSLETLPEEPIPTTAEGLQQYFIKYIQAGEALSKQGPDAYEMAAQCFLRAIQVYPEPMQLMTSLQQSIHPAIMELIMAHIAAQVEKSKDQQVE
ncbi:protein import receptor MAS20 [Gorgonomyces haynaldii]|nr:protein import receptor MAS20 [Gorgonomyces haynaldii]